MMRELQNCYRTQKDSSWSDLNYAKVVNECSEKVVKSFENKEKKRVALEDELKNIKVSSRNTGTFLFIRIYRPNLKREYTIASIFSVIRKFALARKPKQQLW